MKALFASLASRLGYTIVPNWRLDRHPQARYLARLLAFLDVDCVLDVGANRGQYHDFLRGDVGYRGWIVSFEPLPAMAAVLEQRRTEDPKWIVQPYALGREQGTIPFNVMASSVFSSALEPRHDAIDWFRDYNRVTERIEVPVRTLDAAVAALRERLPIVRPYLKLDTQGYDLEVIRGAGAFLREVRALQTEASVTPIYGGAPGFAEALAELQRLGFELSGIFANNPGHFPRMLEFDCHMINRAWLGAPGERPAQAETADER